MRDLYSHNFRNSTRLQNNFDAKNKGDDGFIVNQYKNKVSLQTYTLIYKKFIFP